MKKTLYRLISLCTFLFVISSALFFFFFVQFTAPGPLDNKVNLVIPKGLTLTQIAKFLEKEKVISSHFVFKTGVHIFQKSEQLRAGEFTFDTHISPREVMNVLLNSPHVQRKITFIEGMTVKQIINILESTEGLTGDVPTHPPQEGFLFPDTYYFTYGDSKKSIIQRMSNKMSESLDDLWQKKPKEFPLSSKSDVIILASLIEKETSLQEEKPRVASVFFNRLKQKMRLQSDPTIIYALSDGLGKIDRKLYRKDWEFSSPYNTYKNAGLPPTAIANPGYDSILAVFYPADTDDLYFVANGQGGHAFAETLEEHNRNVLNLRKIQSESP